MNEFLEQFLIECRELVEQATDDLLALEEQPGDRERLDGAFRAFHTLKGAAGIVEFAAMGEALHAAEDVLSAARTAAAPVSAQLVGDALTCLDQVVQWLDAIQATGDVPTDAQPAAAALVARFSGVGAESAATPEAPDVVPSPAADLGELARDLLLAQVALLEDPAAEPSPGRTAAAVQVAINVLIHLGRGDDAQRLDLGLRREPQAVIAALTGLLNGIAVSEPPAAAAREPAEPASRGLRVDVERIDALVALAGELTVAKNALAHAAASARDGVDLRTLAAMLKDQHAVLDRLVAELQRSVLHIRVLPLRHVFQRFPRLVRETVVALGKPARLVTEGDATEADKAIVENLFEPLLHVMRNALDHGVEDAATRAARGKPPSASIQMRAARQGDQVIVEVADDGGGVDVARVRRVAVERGVVAAERAAQLSDDEVIDLIFAPGFSTADEVTALSGRGVGMDAVRAAIERLGGEVGVESRPGEGTTVRFSLPFTVMMSRVMTVEAGGQMFGIPMEAILETVRVPRADIVSVGAAQAFVLRDRTAPLIDLAQVLGVTREAGRQGDAQVVVVTAAGQFGALEVDRLGERMDVMLKPMDGLLAAAPGVAGATLLGDGRVLIVLDLQGLLI